MRMFSTRGLVVAASGSLVLLSLAGIAATSLPTVAGSIPDAAYRTRLSHGPGNCQTSLPVYDGNVRKRPLAIANEGGSSAFLTCDFDDIDNEGGSVDMVGLYVMNQSAPAGTTVSCTMVDGVAMLPALTTYSPMVSSPMAAGGGTPMTWTAEEHNDGTYFNAPSLSCNLPPGVAIVAVANSYLEDVGT